MEGARLAAGAELLHLKTIWIIATILLSDVIALFTLHTGHGDLGADIRALAGHRRTPYIVTEPRAAGGRLPAHLPLTEIW